MRWLAALAALCAAGAAVVSAQHPAAAIRVRVTTPLTEAQPAADPAPANTSSDGDSSAAPPRIHLVTHPDQTTAWDGSSDDASFAPLRPGMYRVIVERAGFMSAQSLVRVSPGESVTLVATLAPVTAADGKGSSLSVESRRGGAPGHVLDPRAVRNLPSSNSIDALIETTQPEIIGDRLETGGLSVGEPMRVGARGTSWTQTTYRFGDAELVDPLDGGRPPLLPDLAVVDQVETTTALMPIERSAPGPDILLVPRRPASSWERSVEFSAADPGLIARNSLTAPPAIARLGTWETANVLLSGPLVPDRLGVVVAGSWTGSTRFQRDAPGTVRSQSASAFAHLVLATTPRDELRALLLAEHRTRPFGNALPFGGAGLPERDDAVEAQGAWERRGGGAPWWTVSASLLNRQVRPEGSSIGLLYVDRLRDGPVADVLGQRATARGSWSVAAHLTPAGADASGAIHGWRFGLDASGRSVRAQPPAAQTAAELVAGIPARIWISSAPGVSHWRDWSLAAYAADRIAIRRSIMLESGLRFETMAASAVSALQRIRWNDWLPRFSIRWQPIAGTDATLFTGVGRYAHRLPLGALAYGDPNAPTARVYRWNDSNEDGRFQPGELGPLVARAGPGSAADAAFSAIDPRLSRPHSDEFVMGVDVRSPSRFMFQLTGIARRDADLIAPVDTGVTYAGYSRLLLPDPGVDIATGATAQLLTIYDRLPAAFGADRYLLTNPDARPATFVGAEAVGQLTFARFQVLAGVTAGRAAESAPNRGFGVTENDSGLLGELYIDPNAASWARGRPFTERGYTIKASGVWQLTSDTTLGVIGRYQDGEHFSRIVIVPALNQGPEIVRAFPNGLTRFEYTTTVDARLQKRFQAGNHAVDGLLDVFNLFNLAKEVEENPVTGPASRRTTAVQPPLALHIGLRVHF